MKTFGKLLRKLRMESCRSIGELARHLKVSTVYVSDVERGVRAPLTTDRIRETALFLGIDPLELLMAAAHEKKVFEFDLTGASQMEFRALSGMARGGMTDEKWEEILRIVEEEHSDD